MSRFYHALQEARRTASEGNTFAAEPEKRESGDDGGPVRSYPRVMAAAASAGESHPTAERMDREIPMADLETGWFGIPARMVLDESARLIPHAVDATVVEHYRRLRAKIIQEQERKPFRSLLVTSPDPEDGKSVTALNLALSFGMLPSHRVLVVDGDLRKGSLGKWLGVGDHSGLSNLIGGSAELEDVVLKCDEIPVSFIVRGSDTTSPAELLHSSRLIPQLQKMTEHFSLVIVDSPAVNSVADAQLLAAACDAALLVARAFTTTRKTLQKAVQDLSPFRVIGTVLNRGLRNDLYRRYKYYE